ncbi:hypothetical protein [Porticoccus hydrocarbonoclasticus]|uniref:hypothetical protein n=1 Tax=Porticoccus hydrocarbonoclasticus TaxID=1073414 RepID=UPI002355E03F|nr:hypothetical protein [Porticoccus hydrocarbonoclasticus]
MASLKLPEKTFFTFDEITDRWNCDHMLVRHYLDEGLLRPSIETKSLPANALFFAFEETAKRLRKEKKVLSVEHWREATTVIIPDNCCDFIFDSQVAANALPRFLYVNPAHLFEQALEQGVTTVVATLEGLDGALYGLADWAFEDEFKPYLLNIGYLHRWALDPYTFEVIERIWDTQAVVISREERDRFEREHGMSTTDPADYSTPHLEVLRDAINHFYNPRRDLDPKRDEVVEWISDRLRERGQSDPGSIARAMFTIIKPPDHNPRRRRGQT